MCHVHVRDDGLAATCVGAVATLSPHSSRPMQALRLSARRAAATLPTHVVLPVRCAAACRRAQ
jgi:hypothetical protein